MIDRDQMLEHAKHGMITMLSSIDALLKQKIISEGVAKSVAANYR